MKTFWQFCEERENIRKRKESGAAEPWTLDEVLRVNHFTNVKREDDRGTKLLFDKIAGLPLDKKIFWVFVYRLSGSNPGILDLNLNNVSVEVPEGKPTFSAKAYSLPCFPKGKGIAMRFLKEWLPTNIETILNEINLMKGLSINVAAERLYNLITELTGYPRMKFHCGEISKDLSVIIPDQINPDSAVNLGPGCMKGLRKIGVKANQGGVAILLNDPLNELRLNFSAIEHAACEYGKYVAIHEVGQHRNRVRDAKFRKGKLNENK